MSATGINKEGMSLWCD